MDPASHTIDRHEPLIPDFIQGEMTVAQEHLATKIKNKFVLRFCNVGQVKRWAKTNPKADRDPPKIVTSELLGRAEDAVFKCADLPQSSIDYLASRGVGTPEISKYRICATEHLKQLLYPEDVHNLSLEPPARLGVAVEHGISVPHFHDGRLWGFCTRLLGCETVKYCFTIPHRYCFGVDLTRLDEIYVVEGVFDAIRLMRLGLNCMALGDSQPNYFKMVMANRFKHVSLLFDNDYSGMLGAAKAHIILEEMLGRKPSEMSILVPPAKDPAELDGVANCSKSTLRNLATTLTLLGRTV